MVNIFNLIFIQMTKKGDFANFIAHQKEIMKQRWEERERELDEMKKNQLDPVEE